MQANYIKSPLNYIGGKYKILDQIIPNFPKNINCFVDLFAGGANVGINVDANKIIFNDNLNFLIELYGVLLEKDLETTLHYIDNQINEYKLSKENELGYKEFREKYNNSKKPLDLLILIFYSFNHQIRFNNSHKFNNPFGKNRSSYNQNIKNNLINFVTAMKEKNVFFEKGNFDNFDCSKLTNGDFVYCDPPYLITTGSYNDGKRGFTGWGKREEIKLLKMLDSLNKKNIKFALSNVLIHKGNTNKILLDWIEEKKYWVNHLNKNYSNSSYNTKNRDKSSSDEVLITNYPKSQMEFF